MPIEIIMPRLSDTMEVGTILHWHVNEGDEVSAGDVLADIETDKATMELQSFDDGTVGQIVIKAGNQVSVGTTIATLLEEDEDSNDTNPVELESGVITEAEEETLEDTIETPLEGGGARVSPVARRLAEDHGVDLKAIQGSGSLWKNY